MATITFTKKPQATKPAETKTATPKTENPKKEAPKTEAPTPATAVAITPKATLPALPMTTPQLTGEWTRNDVATPYLSLGQKTGELTDEHPDWLGKWIYNKQDCLGDSINAVFAFITKRYEEDLEFGSEDIPRRYDRKADADAEGVQVRDIADLDLFIEVGEEMADKATIEADGKYYAPVRYTVRSTAYGATVKILLKDYAGWLKGDLRNGLYVIEAEKRTGPKGSWFAPKLKPAGPTSDALKEALAQV